MPFTKLANPVNFKILDFLGKCPTHYTVQCVSKNTLKIVALYNEHCSEELRSLIPNIQSIWGRLSPLEKFRLQSPLILKRLRAFDSLQGRVEQSTYRSILLGGTCDLSKLSKFQLYALRLGLEHFQVTDEKLCGRHLFAISFTKLTFENVIGLEGKQIDAAIEGCSPDQVIGLNPTQIEGIKRKLTRDQVCHDWFSQSHVDAIDKGIPYDDIARLNYYQVEGIMLHLTRFQVTGIWFSKFHIAAIKMGFTYGEISYKSAEVPEKVVYSRILDDLIENGADQERHHDHKLFLRWVGLIEHRYYNKKMLSETFGSMIKEDVWYKGSELECFVNTWKDRLEVLRFNPDFDADKEAKTFKESKDSKEQAELAAAKWNASLALVPSMLPQFGSIKPIVGESTEAVSADPSKNKVSPPGKM